MKTQTLICLGHQKGVGKNTFAKHLVGIHKLIGEFSIANNPKKAAASAFSELRSPEYYEMNPKEKDVIIPSLNLTPRDIYIKIADWAEQIDNLWAVKSVIRDIKQKGWVLNVVTDLRYIKEVIEFNAHFNTIYVKVEREGFNKTEGHKSETDLLTYPWDFIFTNDGTEKELRSKIHRWLSYIICCRETGLQLPYRKKLVVDIDDYNLLKLTPRIDNVVARKTDYGEELDNV